MARCIEYSLLLLAGGRSLRMGRPKAELPYRGQTFLWHMLDKGRQLGLQACYIAGYDAGAQAQTVPDLFPDRGPLGGIHAGLQAMTTPYCLVLPVDAPTLPVEILEGLLMAHENAAERNRVLLWEHGQRQEPLIAVYPAAMLQSLEELLRGGAAPVFRALDRWGYDCWRQEMDREQIINVNTPELYERLLAGDG